MDSEEIMRLNAEAARNARDLTSRRIHFDPQKFSPAEYAAYQHGMQQAYEHGAKLVRDERRAKAETQSARIREGIMRRAAERGGCPMTNLTTGSVVVERDHATPIVEALHAAGFEATFDHSGGGCGTIYVGPTHTHPEGWEHMFAALLGPFNFYSGECDDEMVYVGPDDFGESEALSIPPLDIETIVGAVRKLVAAAEAGAA